MQPTQPRIAQLRVTDLVLNPLALPDALQGSLRDGLLAGDEVERLATLLPVAVAQLDALGDGEGAFALAALADQLHALA